MLVYLTQYELQEKQSLHNGIRKASAEYFMAYCNNNSTPIPIPSSYLSSIRITHNIPCPKNYYERNLRKPNSCVDLFRPCLECRIFIGKAYSFRILGSTLSFSQNPVITDIFPVKITSEFQKGVHLNSETITYKI